MIIVSGCPRSGTSLLMDVMRVAFGEDRILGAKFPQEQRRDRALSQGEHESAAHFATRSYLFEHYHRGQTEADNDFEDMNPNGFWECLYTVRGITWAFPLADQLEKLLQEPKDQLTICKIVSQGLANSDPRFIDKIVYMVRHPRAVAKSQERLKRGPRFRGENGKLQFASDGLRIHTPEMFIQVTAAAARWLQRYPQVPIHFVHFDDLVERPQEVLNEVQTFLGGGNFTDAAKQIEPKLRRSEPEDIASPLWEDAEVVYEHFVSGDYPAIFAYLSNPRRAIHRQNRHWFCPRAHRQVTEEDCHRCQTTADIRSNMKRWCEQNQGNWRTAPCPFECGFDLDREDHLSIEESIRHNFWLSEQPSMSIKSEQLQT